MKNRWTTHWRDLARRHKATKSTLTSKTTMDKTTTRTRSGWRRRLTSGRSEQGKVVATRLPLCGTRVGPESLVAEATTSWLDLFGVVDEEKLSLSLLEKTLHVGTQEAMVQDEEEEDNGSLVVAKDGSCEEESLSTVCSTDKCPWSWTMSPPLAKRVKREETLGTASVTTVAPSLDDPLSVDASGVATPPSLDLDEWESPRLGAPNILSFELGTATMDGALPTRDCGGQWSAGGAKATAEVGFVSLDKAVRGWWWQQDWAVESEARACRDKADEHAAVAAALTLKACLEEGATTMVHDISPGQAGNSDCPPLVLGWAKGGVPSKGSVYRFSNGFEYQGQWCHWREAARGSCHLTVHGRGTLYVPPLSSDDWGRVYCGSFSWGKLHGNVSVYRADPDQRHQVFQASYSMGTVVCCCCPMLDSSFCTRHHVSEAGPTRTTSPPQESLDDGWICPLDTVAQTGCDSPLSPPPPPPHVSADGNGMSNGAHAKQDGGKGMVEPSRLAAARKKCHARRERVTQLVSTLATRTHSPMVKRRVGGGGGNGGRQGLMKRLGQQEDELGLVLVRLRSLPSPSKGVSVAKESGGTMSPPLFENVAQRPFWKDEEDAASCQGMNVGDEHPAVPSLPRTWARMSAGAIL